MADNHAVTTSPAHRAPEDHPMSEKWPRHYASEILDIPTRAARAAHLEIVPDHLRDLVRRHVEDHFVKVRGYKRHC